MNKELYKYQVKIFDEVISVESVSTYEAKKLASILFKNQHKGDKLVDSFSISSLVIGARAKKLWS